MPNICSNDCYAIQCAGKPTRLHRDSANASINRANTACRSPDHPSVARASLLTRILAVSSVIVERRVITDCLRIADCLWIALACEDEYPYASSQEGGAGSVTRCVPSTENSRQGGTLSSFYTNNGVIDRDAYNVAFASTRGLQYCSASCTNTGNEVTKRNLAIATQHIARHFLTDQGHQLTSKSSHSFGSSADNARGRGKVRIASADSLTHLFGPADVSTVFERVDSPGSLDSLIGTHAWLAHEERNVTIASALASAP